jgi:phosphatidylserine/phosphatidylglycerophosphate/cardiolipin synthase-like enzyme
VLGLIITHIQAKEDIPEEKELIFSENGTLEICFSKQENCTKRIIPLLSSASRISASLYDLDEPSIIKALQDKNADLIIDEDNYAGFGKKIKISGLMHNKFFLIYNASGNNYLITGSTNPTKNDLYKNDNNMIIIKSDYLFKNYEKEFSEIKSAFPESKTKYKKILFNGFEVENYFCPEDGCEEEVLSEINSAKNTIYFMTFSFTSDKIGSAIVHKKDLLEIRGIFDSSQVASNKEYSEYYVMKENEINVKIENSNGKLHHKVFIIDNETIITGSYNPTASGDERNAENIIIIHNKGIAQEYLKEFERIWEEN